jgi:hypothetical protein
MYCPSCGTSNAPDANFCTKCGKNIGIEKASTPTTSTTAKSAPKITSKPSIEPGVKGWLLFLCVALTIVGPAVTLYSVSQNYSEMSQAFGKFPDLKFAVFVESSITVAISAFGVFAGYALWKIKPNAVLMGKIYMVAYGGFALASPFLFFELANLPREIERLVEDELVKQTTRGLAGSIIWLMFLFKSERVKATYH